MFLRNPKQIVFSFNISRAAADAFSDYLKPQSGPVPDLNYIYFQLRGFQIIGENTGNNLLACLCIQNFARLQVKSPFPFNDIATRVDNFSDMA